MKIQILIIIPVLAFNIVSCNLSLKSKSVKVATADDNTMNSSDWDVNYQGILPCAGCEGIKTQLALNSDLTYVLQTQYLGKNDTVFSEEGKFTWDEKGNSITLDNSNKQKYLVGENRIFHSGNNGNEITGDLTRKYILEKENAELTGKYWKLVRLNGHDIGRTAKEPFIKFNSENKSASGNSGCNSYNSSFETEGNSGIKFGPVMSTKMACVGMSTEALFFEVLEKTTNYVVSPGTLILQDKNETTLAKFESDFFK